LDDSTHVKREAQAMEGQGWHYSSSDKRAMPGHSLFAGVYVLLGQQFPLSPQMYRQRAVCEQDGVPFHSKVDLAVQTIQTFQRVAPTRETRPAGSWITSWNPERDLTRLLRKCNPVRSDSPRLRFSC